ncbi:hypothetical protein PGT21_005451 [Puccinia graminis f. sp. tritici]|uniref:Uncharacterized protein n=1 Tax=Puccinia graminis f. sp. tritici TaxID=56615 RepID=A0A5B0N3C9_PUCGR|nr:hypothetical protein PGT21_005451 [Puccinia graminis f. sp. tritici]
MIRWPASAIPIKDGVRFRITCTPLNSDARHFSHSSPPRCRCPAVCISDIPAMN